MNSTFKVVFNKARGALMVVNEVTSSVQAKGTKTVVATAVAAMIAGVAGVAQAAEITVGEDGTVAKIEVTGTDTIASDATVTEKFNVGASGTLTAVDSDGAYKSLTVLPEGSSNAGTLNLGGLTIGYKGSFTNTGTINLDSDQVQDDEGNGYDGTLEVNKEASFTNTGRVNVGTVVV
ncbi:MAG: ESPR domain-containing protein, partial [Sutterella sp.]|nr:ESPR domain-containing protein [Sutterella sp.]